MLSNNSCTFVLLLLILLSSIVLVYGEESNFPDFDNNFDNNFDNDFDNDSSIVDGVDSNDIVNNTTDIGLDNTNLSLFVSDSEVYVGNVVFLSVVLLDSDGSPVVGRVVSFYIGDYYLGYGVTDSNGRCSLVYIADSVGSFVVSAFTSPDSVYAGSSGSGFLKVFAVVDPSGGNGSNNTTNSSNGAGIGSDDLVVLPVLGTSLFVFFVLLLVPLFFWRKFS